MFFPTKKALDININAVILPILCHCFLYLKIMIVVIIFFGNIFFWYLMYKRAGEKDNTQQDEMFRRENEMLRKRTIKGKHEKAIRSTLENHFEYYQKLNEEEKTRFFTRVCYLIRAKRIRGVKGMEITIIHRTLVCACIVQVTFGIPNARMSHVRSILIYPDIFESYFTRHKMKGSYNVKGILNLSWPDFIAGYEDPNDCFNVGIHEVAHALQLGSIMGYVQDDFFSVYHEKWELLSKRLLGKRRVGELDFLRSYSKTNDKEFFAVVVEHFFENPQELKDETPGMYYHLCILLNQDPLQLSSGAPRLHLAQEHENIVFKGSPIATFKSKKFNITFIGGLLLLGIALLASLETISLATSIVLLISVFTILFYMIWINKRLHHIELFSEGIRFQPVDIQKMPLNYSYRQLVGLYRKRENSLRFDCISTEAGQLVDIPMYLNLRKTKLYGLRKILKEKNVVLAGLRL